MQSNWETRGGVRVECAIERVEGAREVAEVAAALDERRGMVLTSSTEIPGRYRRWDLAFVDPPLVVEARGRKVRVTALNERGRVLLALSHSVLESAPDVAGSDFSPDVLELSLRAQSGVFSEEERSRQPSVFGLLRRLRDHFGSDADPHLGLYGAFGYDLAFQFEPIPVSLPRDSAQRDLVLYLADDLVTVDHRLERAERRCYEFSGEAGTTVGLARDGERRLYQPSRSAVLASDHGPGEYAAVVELARESFARGDLFEVVPGQMFKEPCVWNPSVVFDRLRRRNPAPYGFLANLGDGEYLVGASPEMFVRVTGRRVETAPISGTIARGADAIEDAEQVFRLLASEKEESELTMCTDVDRNDKSRVCEPDSVKILARRSIEMYSRLIHTVDHVEGTLAPGYDALDAFLSHAWAVTVTGAPKRAAMEFIETHEKSARRWYGGAIGRLGFDGDLNTGLTLRTVRIHEGVAEVRAGATLLFESDPEAEEAETRVKASALLDAIQRPDETPAASAAPAVAPRPGRGRRVLLVDAQDSFVHTLAGYFRRSGAKVKTLRAGFPIEEIARLEPDLIVLSPGPGRPADFGFSAVIGAACALELPVFGVCLGLQGIAEYFGAELEQLPAPRHGKRSRVRVVGGESMRALPRELRVGRYHSLVVRPDSLPPELRVTAFSEDDRVMALEHRSLPVAGVQFHPESLLTLEREWGLRLIETVVADAPVRERHRETREITWS
ncbi:MAG: anthranilate synthase component I [Myxococcales bacterium]|nr:anthranilate synthase component I [Myxococcales bacterium]